MTGVSRRFDLRGRIELNLGQSEDEWGIGEIMRRE